MKEFYKRIDMRSRTSMQEFLRGHFRYSTMNSWNRATSYANCVKIHRLGLTPEQLERAWSLLDMHEPCDDIQEVLNAWAAERNWAWQVGLNGRSSGYLVLYQGGLDHANASTARCDSCGKLTYHRRATPCTTNGCDGVLRVLPEPVPRIVTFPGRGTDYGEDFADWSIEDLRERVSLVQDFDRVCDAAVGVFTTCCDDYHVVEKEILVPSAVKVLEHD